MAVCSASTMAYLWKPYLQCLFSHLNTSVLYPGFNPDLMVSCLMLRGRHSVLLYLFVIVYARS